MNLEKFAKGRLKSTIYAIKGFFILLRTEDAIILHSLVTIVLTAMGFYFEISATEWIAQLLALALVFVSEGLNTAIEKVCDFIHPQFHSHIGTIKDISAGAVTFAAVFGAIVGAIIYFPKFFEKFCL